MFNKNYGKVINNSERQINKFVPKSLFSRSKIVKKKMTFLKKDIEEVNKEESDNEDKEKNEI